MPQKRETQVQQRDRQLGEEVYPTGGFHATRNPTRRPRYAGDVMTFLRAIQADIMILLSGRRADITALLRARQAEFSAHCRGKGAEFYAFPLWKKFLFVGASVLVLLFTINIPYLWRLEAERKHCASEWILDTAAPYHTTNQPLAFAPYSAKQYSSPITYYGYASHGVGLVKLDLQYYNLCDKCNTSVSLNRLYSYTPLELHSTQYVPNKPNTISVSQLMRHNDGEKISNKAVIIVYEHRALGLRIGNNLDIMAAEREGHYVLSARVPGRRTQCPDPKERSIFKVSEPNHSTTSLAM